MIERMNRWQELLFVLPIPTKGLLGKSLKRKRVTGTETIKDDLENSGAIWVDECLVIDGHLISSQTPKDLPLFAQAIVEAIQ